MTNRSTSPELETLPPQTLYRGLYVRVARRVGADPSYVSRVARGERQSKEIESALRREIEEIGRRLGRRVTAAETIPRRPQRKRLRVFVKQNGAWLRQEWLHHSQADSNLRKIKIAPQKRTAPLLPLLNEAIRAMKLSVKEMQTVSMGAAQHHGKSRHAQGFSPTELAEEYNLIRRCIFALAEKHFQQMDPHLLFHDLAQIAEALDLQLQHALRSYLASA